jgi:hypothetical protein
MVKHNVSLFRAIPPAFIFWKDNLLKLVFAGLIVAIPMQFTIELSSYLFYDLMPGNELEKIRHMNSIYNLIRALFWPIATLGIINYTFNHFSGRAEERSAVGIVLFGLFRWPKYFLASLLAFLKVLLYTLALIIPGIYKGVRLTFVDCIVATKDPGPGKACDESEMLVKNNWWRIFGFGLLLFLFEMLIEGTIFLPALAMPDSPFITFTLSMIVKSLVTYLVVLRAVYYFEVDKVRNQELTNAEMVSSEPLLDSQSAASESGDQQV